MIDHPPVKNDVGREGITSATTYNTDEADGVGECAYLQVLKNVLVFEKEPILGSGAVVLTGNGHILEASSTQLIHEIFDTGKAAVKHTHQNHGNYFQDTISACLSGVTETSDHNFHHKKQGHDERAVSEATQVVEVSMPEPSHDLRVTVGLAT